MIILSIVFLILLGAPLISHENRSHKRYGRALFTTLILSLIYFAFLYSTAPKIRPSNLLFTIAISSIIALVIIYPKAALIKGAQNRRYTQATSTGSKDKTAIIFQMLHLFIFFSILGLAVVLISQSIIVRPIYKSVQVKVKTEAPLTTKEQPVALSADASKSLMTKAFSNVPNSSQFKLGSLTAQYVNGKPVYIAPVEFNGIFSWMSNQYKAPGYFTISATDINATPKFVKTELKYNETGYFNHNVDRKLSTVEPGMNQIGGSTLEIDESGEAYWTATLAPRRWNGQTSFDKFKVVVMSAKTGKSKVYPVEKAPAWIDDAVSPEAASTINLAYAQPYAFNFSHNGELKPTSNGSESGVTPIFGQDGRLSYFDDFTTPSSKADSDQGYSLINSDTGQMTFYKGKNVGITDSNGAIKVANKLHPQNQYKGSNPVIMNINGEPTWVVSMLDSNHRFRQYIYIKGADVNIVAEGNTAIDALSAYQSALNSNISLASSDDNKNSKPVKIEGKISRINLNAMINNKQMTVFMLAGDKTTYTVDPSSVPISMLTAVGDEVKLSVIKTEGSTTASVQKIDNVSLAAN